MKKTYIKSQAGFTLVELMIATMIFSIVLVVILASFLQIGRMYYKGVSVSSTNEATRAVVDDITNDVRLAQQVTNPLPEGAGSPYNYFCVGQHRYSYEISTTDHKVTSNQVSSPNASSPNGVVQDNIGNGCPNPSQPGGAGTAAQQLLGANMQLNDLKFICTALSGSVNSCSLTIRVVYYGADDTVLKPSATDPNATCSGNLLSTQFCAETEFSTVALTSF